MAEEAIIQVALDGAGKSVKQFLLRGVPQPDGTYADVYVQAVSVQGSDGRAVDWNEAFEEIRAIRKELRWIRRGFGELIDNAAMTLGVDEDET